MFRNDFIINDVDKCIYSKQYNDIYVVLYLYVDDILIFERYLNVIEKIKSFLSRNFYMKDFGRSKCHPWIKPNKNKNGIILTQSNYVEKHLKKINYDNVTPVSTPYDSKSFKCGVAISQYKYSQIIRSLMCLSNCTNLI